MKGKQIKKLIVEFLLVLMSLTMIIPFVMLLLNSFKTQEGASQMNLALPKVWNIVENYTLLFQEADILTALKNSVINSFLTVFIVIILASMSAFIIQRRGSKLAMFIYSFIMLGMIMPRSMAPTYFMVQKMGLLDSYFGVVGVYTAKEFALAVFLYTGFFKSIPRDIDESGIIDGCGPIRLFFQIIFPLMKPITFTIIILSFMSVWNDFQVALYLSSAKERMTLVLSTYLFHGQNSSRWNLVFADIVVIIMPVVILYFSFQRHIVSGMTAGAVKG